MSELQNRIVERLVALDFLRQGDLTPDKREQVMVAAIGLFYATGGDAAELKEIVLKANAHERSDVAQAVAQMVVTTAAVSYAYDLDLIQAAYNWIDHTPVSLSD